VWIDQETDPLADLAVIQQRHQLKEGGGTMVKRLKQRGRPRPRLVGKEEAAAFLARVEGVMSEEDITFLRSILDAHQSIRDVLESPASDAEGLERIQGGVS
jgi:hypothetical protein